MNLRKIIGIICGLIIACAFVACDETGGEWNPYHNWKERNAQWYEQVADTARQAIAQAKARYGAAWEDHCDWRMYKTLTKSQDYNSGKLTDSICVKIAKRGEGPITPHFSDTVRLSFRGWLMNTQFDSGDGKLYDEMRIFTQTYYGDYDPATASPSTSSVSAMISGFQTALQYMVEGDEWFVYLPQELAYGKKAESEIPAYSTLLFRINMVGVYRAGTGVPAWKVSPRSTVPL